jgi:adenosine 3'-phospho 5'-phosphosulfate transporter B2
MADSVQGETKAAAHKPAVTAFDQVMWALPEPLQRLLAANQYALGVAWSCFGIIGFLVVYGLLQERIMKHPYGEEGEEESFTWSLFLVMTNRLVTCSVNIVLLYFFARSEMAPVAPLYKYAAVSVSNVVATYCQYEALRYVSFPLQTLGKTAKMIPVMIWGYFISKKKYGVRDYAIAIGVTIGCAVFVMFGDEFSAKRANSKNTSMYGVMLMGGYLLFDGFTSTFQDKLFSGYKMSTYNQIFYVQGCSAIFSGLSLLTSGQLMPALSFVQRHPDALAHALTLSGASTCSNLFISWTIKTYGALIFATIMTTRQFISILTSCIMYMHPLSFPGQYVGMAIVFAALYYKSFTTKDKKKSPAAPAGPSAEATPEDLEAAKGLLEKGQPTSA